MSGLLPNLAVLQVKAAALRARRASAWTAAPWCERMSCSRAVLLRAAVCCPCARISSVRSHVLASRMEVLASRASIQGAVRVLHGDLRCNAGKPYARFPAVLSRSPAEGHEASSEESAEDGRVIIAAGARK